MLALLGAIGSNGMAIFIKLAFRYGVAAVKLIMYRIPFALPLFFSMTRRASRGHMRNTKYPLGIDVDALTSNSVPARFRYQALREAVWLWAGADPHRASLQMTNPGTGGRLSPPAHRPS
jgi:hypothetical protein